MAYVLGADVLTHVGKGSPSAADSDWADVCAAAVEGATLSVLDGMTPTADETAQLVAAALTDAAALFGTRASPNFVLSVGPDGDAVMLGPDQLRAVTRVIHRIHPTAGIGIG